MSRGNRSVAWTAGAVGAVGVVLGGMLGVVAGGIICAATGECGLEGFLFAGWGLIIGIPLGGLRVRLAGVPAPALRAAE